MNTEPKIFLKRIFLLPIETEAEHEEANPFGFCRREVINGKLDSDFCLSLSFSDESNLFSVLLGLLLYFGQMFIFRVNICFLSQTVVLLQVSTI